MQTGNLEFILAWASILGAVLTASGFLYREMREGVSLNPPVWLGGGDVGGGWGGSGGSGRLFWAVSGRFGRC